MEPSHHVRPFEPVPGWHVEHVIETGSTNADLLERATSSPHRTVRFTDHQTAGRGRLDRRWAAPPGSNLLVSLLFTEVPDDPTELARRVGLAAVDAARRVAGVTAFLKWPNDVLTADGKLAGILSQRAPNGSVVVGIGVNVGWAPDGAAKLGDQHAPPEVLRHLLLAFDELPADISDRYRADLGTLGQRVRVELPVGEIVGTAIGVEPDGRLIVVDDCAISHRVDVGDIIHLRPADAPRDST